MRVFIAIDLSEEAKKEIAKLYKKVLFKKHWPVNWIEPEKLHLTLAFLGKVKIPPSPRLRRAGKEIVEAVGRGIKGVKPFEINFKSLGCFPDFDWPRVIWLGLKGDLKSLAKMQKGIKEELLQIRKEVGLGERVVKGLERPFSAHITLGRIKKARGRQRREIGRQVRKIKEKRLKIKDKREKFPPSPPAGGFGRAGKKQNSKIKLYSDDLKFLVDKVVIYESRLSRSGAEYRKLEEIKILRN